MADIVLTKHNFITDMTMERGDSPLAGRRPAPLNNVRNMNTISIGSSAPLSSLHAPNSASTLQSMPSLPPLGGLSSSLQSPTTAPHSTTSFWRELKDVEIWFDSLDPQERVTLVATLAARTPEQQLHQFASTIDKALRNQNTANLSRFGVGQDQSVYRYRSPLSAGGPASAAPTGSTGTGSAQPPGATNSARTPVQSQAPSTAAAAAASSNPVPAVTSTPGTTASSAAAGSAPNSAKNYSHAFLPLGYSPWGTEIRRPNSATADAWPDTTARGSPTVANAEPDGSPIGLKPWRTFTPQQPIGSQIGQAPERSLLYPYRLYQNGSSVTISGPSQNAHTQPQASQSGPGSSGHGPGGPGSSGHESTRHGSSGQDSNRPVSKGPGPNEFNAHDFSPSEFSAPDFSARGSNEANGGTSNGGLSNLVASHGHEFNGNRSSGRDSGAGPGGGSGAPGAGPGDIGSGGSGGPGRHGSGGNNHSSGAHGSDDSEQVAQSGTPAATNEPRARRSVNVVDVELLSDIGAWLRSLRLHKYTGNLSGMHWQDVIQLSDEDLEIRGVNALGARRKLLKMFEEIRHAQEEGLLVE